MNYNPNIHHRRTIRLQTYDYSNEGLYFVTICTHNRQPLFGQIVNDEMELNDAGRMVEKWYKECENHFNDIKCLEMIIMPNHFHCIWYNVGADRCVCPKTCTNTPINMYPGEHTGSPLHRIVQWFKTMTTNEYIRGVKFCQWLPFNKRLWQRNYYEHIIRTQHSYEEIVTYILENPKRWSKDSLYIKTP